MVQKLSLVDTQASMLSPDDEAWLRQKITVFRSLVGAKHIKLIAEQAEVVAEIHERFPGVGLLRLREETGLNERRIVTLLHFHRHLKPADWVEKLPVEYHLIVAYQYGVAADRFSRSQMRAGYTPGQWLLIAGERGWSCDELRQQMLVCYGAYINPQKLVEVAEELERGDETSEGRRGPRRPVARVPMLPVVKKRVEEWQARRNGKRHRDEPELPTTEDVLALIDGFVRSFRSSFQPRRRTADQRESIYERLETLLHRELPDVLRSRRELLSNWGPDGCCLVCGTRNNPHQALGHCTKCFQDEFRKRNPKIMRYLANHGGRPLRPKQK